MRDEAQRYCSLVEKAASFSREDFATAAVEALARAVAAASRLPDVEPSDADLPDGPPQDEARERFHALGAVLGDWDEYRTTPAPHGEDAEELSTGSLSDDLGDVWVDLKQGLLALEAGAAPDDVTWEWRFGFSVHWGRHATEALRALHARLADAGYSAPDGAGR